MTFIEKFEEIKKKIGKPDISKLTESFAIQINLTDEDCGGAFYIAYTDGNLEIEPYDYHDNTASVNVRAKDLIDIITGKLDALAAIMTGKMDVYGNIDHAKALALLKKASQTAHGKQKHRRGKNNRMRRKAKKENFENLKILTKAPLEMQNFNRAVY